MAPTNKPKITPEQFVQLRLKAGHTQDQAADYLYVSKRTIQNWELSISRIPRAMYEFYELKAVAEGLVTE